MVLARAKVARATALLDLLLNLNKYEEEAAEWAKIVEMGRRCGCLSAVDYFHLVQGEERRWQVRLEECTLWHKKLMKGQYRLASAAAAASIRYSLRS